MTAKAQARYDTLLATKKLSDGRTVFVSARPKIVNTDVQDIVVHTNDFDRADIMASNIYGSASDWWRIISANGNFKGSIHFSPGQAITIPRKK